MNDIETAKARFKSGSYSCVLVKGDVVYTSEQDGIAPMLGFISDGTNLTGFSVADKIVGKAAALLFVLAGVKEVFACVMSRRAVEVFAEHGVKYSFDTFAENIINRAGTDLCPMEKAVSDIENPQEAIDAIKNALTALRAGKTEDTK